jgi:hypothetical protein
MQKISPTFQWKVLKPSKRGGVVFAVAARGEDEWISSIACVMALQELFSDTMLKF